MPLNKSVALAVSSYHGTFHDTTKTGAFYVEVLHPWKTFTDAGFKVDIVSETGSFGWDDVSLTEGMATKEELALLKDPSSAFYKAVNSVKKASDLNPKDYGVFFAAGGHATIFDFDGKVPDLFKLAGSIWDDNGVVSAVCHGPVILSGIKDKNGELIAKGKKLTGFPDSGEKAMGLTDLLDKNHWLYTSTVLKNLGDYQPVDEPFGEKVVVDGRLATGANPASATPLAKAVIKLVEESA